MRRKRWRRMRGVGMIAAGVLVAVSVTLTACGGGGDKATAGCAPDLDPHLTPAGTGPAAFTMGIRVNKDDEVDEIADDFRDRILDRDVFVINAEYPGSKPSDWEAALDRLADRFPCNRVAVLTGLGRDASRPSYQYALVGHPELDAVFVDWEQDSWQDAGRGRWSSAPSTNLARVVAQLRQLSTHLEGSDTRMALVPDLVPRWDYGRIARVIAEANYHLEPIHRGYQVIQTQPNCGDPTSAGGPIGPLTSRLLQQYRGVFGLPLRVGAPKDQPPDMDQELLQHVGFEVAFDQSPNPDASDAVERVGPSLAAACSDAIVKAGGAGIAYWADPPSMKAMLDTPVGRRLRPEGAS